MTLILRELAARFLSLDQGWLRTIRELTVGPGRMIKHYVQWQRKIYAHPFAYLVAGTALSIFIQKLVGFRGKMTALARADTFESPLQMEFFNRFTELVFQNTLYIHLGILIPLALLLFLFFRKSGYNLAENFVFALYSGGQLALLGIVLIPIYMVLGPLVAAKGILQIIVAALESEDVVLVQWALDHGVDVNAHRQARNHATALMIAAGDGDSDMVKKLLDHGADPDQVNHNGDTALDLAKGQNVKELLRAHTAFKE